MPKISPLAVVDPKAELADDVEVGPFCTVGPDVRIGEGTRLISHVVVTGNTTLGKGNTVYPHAVLGCPPQDRSYRGGDTRIEIGDNNLLREAVTIHLGTEKGGGITRIGSNNFFMVNSHAGHDVQVANGCLFANNVMLGGHVVVGENVNMMGGAAVHHLVTVGDYAWVGGYSRIHHDAPPYCKIDGADIVRPINVVGLKRAGFTDDDIDALEDAHRQLFSKEHPLAVAMAQFDVSNGINPHVRRLIEFLDRRSHARHGRHLEQMIRNKRTEQAK